MQVTDQWTAVALAVDVEPSTAVPVLLDGEEIVLWRSASGVLQAWEDRCPHRGMRLSFGFVRGEELACLYHGWHFDTDAACTAIPAHPDLTPPRTICANAYACAETGGFVFVRLGSGDIAAPKLPPATPVRSLTIQRPMETIVAQLPVATGPDRLNHIDLPGGPALLVALHPMDRSRTTLHIAMSGEADRPARLAAAAWSENFRRIAEGVAPLAAA
ncbi:Rieske 2Fe-2S domain-containing protein [Chthonobacter albigriseus]|uniref:Rieske 2Fe-2S domain-containing protein n=1 Tax=Chthonobacter albigriseus TaxID=1683161 RepID=UPI0015EF0C40|nr:Rieske 2Fe-2S domain-containing protein [Chthonobacter albigriseus]